MPKDMEGMKHEKMEEKMKGGMVSLKEKASKRLDAPVESFPHLYLGKDKMKQVFSGAKIGESYKAMIECNLSGDGLEVRGIKLMDHKNKEEY